jgi:cytochrome c556
MNKRTCLGLAVLLAGFSCALEAATPTSTPTAAAGWTGLSRPKDVIVARGKLMERMEILMQPIDTITIQKGAVGNVERLHQNAQTVATLLTLVPHLFPPTTNLYDPRSQTPATIALPAIWQNFESFYALAGAASRAAEEMAVAKGDKGLRASSLKLRASCDACHAGFLRKYEGVKASSADQQFDFDSVLPPKK